MAKTSKQKEFDLVITGVTENKYEFTKRLRVDKKEDVELIRKYKDQLAWSQIAYRRTLTEEFINEFYEYLQPHFEKLCVNVNVNMEFLKNNRKYINWNDFFYRSNGNRLTVDFLKEFSEEIKGNEPIILTKRSLPKESKEYLLGQNKQVDFGLLSRKTSITLKEIEKYKDKLDWDLLSRYANCLCSIKNFEKYRDRIDLAIFMQSPTNNIKRVKFILSEYFLKNNYQDEKFAWVNFFNISDYLIRDEIGTCNKFNFGSGLVLNLDWFKDNYDILPKKVKLHYRDQKLTQTGKYFCGIKWN